MLQWRHLAEIFIFIKMISHVSFIILVHQIVILSLIIPIKLTIAKIHHLMSLRFEQSELKKSQCAAAATAMFYFVKSRKDHGPAGVTTYGVPDFDTFLP